MRHSSSPNPPGDMPRSYWQATGSAHARRPAQLPAHTNVLVIGGGLLGAATAYWLARSGVATVLIEQGDLASGATGRNGGFMVAGTAERYPAAVTRLGHATARAVWQLTLDNRALLRQVLEEELIGCDYREPGHLHLALGDAQLADLADDVAALRADGFAADLLDRRQLQALIATALGPSISGGLFAPEDGLLHSAHLVHGLAAAAERHGAVLALEQPRNGKRTCQSQDEADRDQSQSLADDEADDVGGLGAHGPTDGDLSGSLTHKVRQHAEEAHRGEEGRHTSEQPNHLRAEPRIRQGVREQFLHGLEPDRYGGIGVVQERAKRACERLLFQRGPRQDGRRIAPVLRRRHEEHRRRRLTRILPPGVGHNSDNFHPRRPAVRPYVLSQGDSPGKAVRARFSLMMATRGRSGVSVLSKSRPAR